MLNYTTIPSEFTHADIVNDIMSKTTSTDKEYFCKRAGARALPWDLKLLTFYAIMENVLTYVQNVSSITRSTNVDSYFQQLIINTNPYDARYMYRKPLGISLETLENLKPNDIFSIYIIPVVGQIQYTFETAIPKWANECNAVENLTVSLALKMTPKHRVRVYKRNEHIFLFTTKNAEKDYLNNWTLQRKLWACIPILRGWIDTPVLKEKYNTLIELYKALAETDATKFWTLLETAFNTNPNTKDLKYSSMIQAFDGIKIKRIENCNAKILQAQQDAQRLAEQYAQVLVTKRNHERFLLDIQNSDTGLDVDCIKHLVDKKVCYNLNVSMGTNNSCYLSYRCSAPLLSYDKDAALIYYNRNIKENFSDSFETIFRLIFIDEKVILNFDEAIDIDLTRNIIQAQSGRTHLVNNLSNTLPNPHHYYYNCWGSYHTTLSKLINEYKLEELFYQIKASVGSLNFTDYTVLNRFITNLNDIVNHYNNPYCFYWRDENCTTLHNLDETFEHFKQEENK